MGLAGRKVKQRIGADPRNLTWADDASKFGQTYLQKLGWDPSKGLGVSGEGRTSHIKVRQKLNLLGIGSNASGESADPMVAWKQNREYEELLRRLNEGKEGKDETDEESKEDRGGGEVKEKKKRKKVVDDAQEDASADDEKRRKKKKQKKEKKDKKKRREDECPNEKAGDEDDKQEASLCEPESASEPSSTSTPAPAPAIQAPTPRPMAHRARFLRSKQLASRSSTAVAEILGISSSNSTPGPSPSLGGTPFSPNSTTPSLNPTPRFTQTPAPEVGQDKDQEIRTASTSVHDYFKEKLAARALARSGTPSAITPSSPSSFSNSAPGPSSTPAGSTSMSSSARQSSSTDVAHRVSQSKNQDETEDNNEAPRAGLGSRANYSISSFAKEDGDAPRAGLSLGVKSKPGFGFGSLMGGFTSASHIGNGEIIRGSAVSPDPDGDRGELDDPEDEEGEAKTKRKKEKKEKKKKRKGEKREEDAIQEEADVEVRKEERKSKSKPCEPSSLEARQATDDVNSESPEKKREREEKRDRKEKKKKRKEKKEKRESDSC